MSISNEDIRADWEIGDTIVVKMEGDGDGTDSDGDGDATDGSDGGDGTDGDGTDG